jgi:hypothetical protein
MNRRSTKSNPLHRSRGPLPKILPLSPCRFQLPIPLGLNLLLMAGGLGYRRYVRFLAANRSSQIRLTPQSHSRRALLTFCGVRRLDAALPFRAWCHIFRA